MLSIFNWRYGSDILKSCLRDVIDTNLGGWASMFRLLSLLTNMVLFMLTLFENVIKIVPFTVIFSMSSMTVWVTSFRIIIPSPISWISGKWCEFSVAHDAVLSFSNSDTQLELADLQIFSVVVWTQLSTGYVALSHFAALVIGNWTIDLLWLTG